MNRLVGLATVVLLLAAACSSTPSQGGATPSGQQASSPPVGSVGSGAGTVSGTLTVNGQPVAGEEVTLDTAIYVEASPAASATPDLRPKATTDASGRFVFSGVEPGTYSLSGGVTVENAFSKDAFGLSWDDPCRAEGFQSFNAAISKNGVPFGTIVAVSNQVTSTNADQVTPVKVGPGEQVTVDIPIVCTIKSGG